jgi:hypothetical protein
VWLRSPQGAEALVSGTAYQGLETQANGFGVGLRAGGRPRVTQEAIVDVQRLFHTYNNAIRVWHHCGGPATGMGGCATSPFPERAGRSAGGVARHSPSGGFVLGALGGIAALLTMLGAYMLAASMSAARRKEFGIRAALRRGPRAYRRARAR